MPDRWPVQEVGAKSSNRSCTQEKAATVEGRPNVPAARATTCSSSSRDIPIPIALVHGTGAHCAYGHGQLDESAGPAVERAVFTGLGDVVPGFAQFGVSADELLVRLGVSSLPLVDISGTDGSQK